MIDSASYLASANKLLTAPVSEVDVRQAISATYYAVFHHVCLHFSKIVLHPGDGQFLRAGSQAYRSIDHGPAKQRCIEACKKAIGFPPGVVTFAEAFIELQECRISADYDPLLHFREQMPRRC